MYRGTKSAMIVRRSKLSLDIDLVAAQLQKLAQKIMFSLIEA